MGYTVWTSSQMPYLVPVCSRMQYSTNAVTVDGQTRQDHRFESTVSSLSYSTVCCTVLSTLTGAEEYDVLHMLGLSGILRLLVS